ncbi:glycosyltransferase family 4 protein [Algoriphagus sp. AK58]|uniref:MraY family glycosyltransferase n=1 Tax=Algoriphagus sp. AK58 TaxID=1406877 RepID=UPI001650B68B|nr:glycosyltransferase family 4 protein [Algoriphagus sp. AK58]MBC6367502.1 UDP-GlcNAc--UDP-phosphate GlcNAc-1-phosphate transferase [Algoriphagus sp. AK58]
MLNSVVLFLCLSLFGYLYFQFAKKYGIVDRPNHRSSHSEVTVRGGGIIFPIAVLFWWMINGFTNTWMVLGLILIATVSMLDDMFTLSRKLRFGIQFLALSLAFYDLGLFQQKSVWALPILYFIALGIINAINFMDGINGITGLYFLAFFGSLLAVNVYLPLFDSSLIQYIILSLFVFLIFNLRKKALMFAGDIGSISLAYLVIYFLAKWYLEVGNWTIILFLLVYGADSFLTLGQRLIRGENVTQPHRSHLYQLLVNQLKQDHVLIALVFALLQFGLNFFLFIYPQSYPSDLWAWAILSLTALIYLSIKIPIQKRFKLI